MTRARSGKTVLRKRSRLRKLTKGFRLSRHSLYRQSVVTLIRSRVYAYRDRRVRKREFRRLWIVRINAACRMRGLRYSEFIVGLQRARVILNRKTLSELAVKDPDLFTRIVELAQRYLPSDMLWSRIRPHGGDPMQQAKALFELIRRKDRNLPGWILDQLRLYWAKDSEWRNTLVEATCEVQFRDAQQREQLRQYLLKIARDLNRLANEQRQPILNAALRRYASMMEKPEADLGKLGEFLENGISPATQRMTLQCIQTVFAKRPPASTASFEGLARKVSDLIRRSIVSGVPKPGDEAALALSALLALAVLGGKDLNELTTSIKNMRAAWLSTLALRLMQSLLDSWMEADPAIEKKNAIVRSLEASLSIMKAGMTSSKAPPSKNPGHRG